MSSVDENTQTWLDATETSKNQIRPLRTLIVDDNHINLSVLSTLLKRRFSHGLDNHPVTVDSGLKAIQLLRIHVFDCILMDIQMPFLSGLETTKRIRAGEDGILGANRNAHIVAVTTAIGDEPEAAYRRAGMDGMIGKPIKFHHLQKYLCPLATEAHVSALKVRPISVAGKNIMPPLPFVSQSKRVFYLPADAATPASRPAICEGHNFENLLRAQTRASLRCDGAVAIARTSTISGSCRRSNNKNKDDVGDQSVVLHTRVRVSSRSDSFSSAETAGEAQEQTSGGKVKQQSRTPSMRISKKTLSQQIAQEVANANLISENSDSTASDSDMYREDIDGKFATPSRRRGRPPCFHRTSSPGWIVPDVTSTDPYRKRSSVSPDHRSLQISFGAQLARPIFNTVSSHESTNSSASTESSNDGTPIGDESITVSGKISRRGSEMSNRSASTGSDASSNVTTPNCSSPSFMDGSPFLPSIEADFGSHPPCRSSPESVDNVGELKQHPSRSSCETVKMSSAERAWKRSDALGGVAVSTFSCGDGGIDEVVDRRRWSRDESNRRIAARRGLDANHATELARSLREMSTQDDVHD